MIRRIAAHKGGRTARAPEARIRPQTLQRIHETMQERKASFADLLEEEYSDTPNEKEIPTMKQIMQYNKDTDKWEPLGPGYSGLSDADAKKHIKQLRQWAKSDKSDAKYKMRDVVLIPR